MCTWQIIYKLIIKQVVYLWKVRMPNRWFSKYKLRLSAAAITFQKERLLHWKWMLSVSMRSNFQVIGPMARRFLVQHPLCDQFSSSYNQQPPATICQWWMHVFPSDCRVPGVSRPVWPRPQLHRNAGRLLVCSWKKSVPPEHTISHTHTHTRNDLWVCVCGVGVTDFGMVLQLWREGTANSCH